MAKVRTGPEGDLYRSVGREIRRRREGLGLTQDDLALRVDLSRASVANVEAGRQAVPLHHLLAISAALGTELGELVTHRPARPEARAPVALPDMPSAARAFVENALRTRS